jgi:hypothetical protein
VFEDQEINSNVEYPSTLEIPANLTFHLQELEIYAGIFHALANFQARL